MLRISPEHKASGVLFSWNQDTSHSLSMCHNVHRVLLAREAYPSFGVQSFYKGFIMKAGLIEPLKVIELNLFSPLSFLQGWAAIMWLKNRNL